MSAVGFTAAGLGGVSVVFGLGCVGGVCGVSVVSRWCVGVSVVCRWCLGGVSALSR